MVKPNNPYARPIDATKESAKLVGEYYGTRATDKKLNHAAGDRNVSPASRYQVAGNAYGAPTTKAKPRGPKPVKVIVDEVPAVTAEDLFG